MAMLHSVDDWCQVMPNLLEHEGWCKASESADASLMHSPCPVGGHLVKIEMRHLLVQNAPENSSQLLVRPEVRGLQDGSCQNLLAPGEAVTGKESWAKLKLCSVLFGDVSGEIMNFFQGSGEWLQRCRRDYPQAGDSAIAFRKESEARECLVLMRPEAEKERFTAYVITRESCFAEWATAYFQRALHSARCTAEAFLNRKGVQELRKKDEQFYVVLSMQSFKRGMPLLPAHLSEKALTEINAGHAHGLPRWVRYVSQRFQLSEYLASFFARLGFQVDTYDTLDGQKLVPYMCVLRREQWEQARERFWEAYPLQKTAYRHANGGSGAPGMHEEVLPKFQTPSNDLAHRMELLTAPRLVIRKTFFDIEEQLTRPERRPRTMAIGAVLAH